DTMIAELTAAFGELEKDPAVRAVVLAGRGKVFCAGADLNWMKKMGELDFEENRRDAIAFGTMLNRLHALAKPTIARVHGAAFAGGMGLIAACDIAVASTDTEFCVSEVRLGLTPATISPYVLAAMGEIACRVTSTARRMGIATVAVYSDADARSRHVALADEAFRIGGPEAKDSYLRGDRILEAAMSSGASAIHPGYGFLSENAEFAER